MAYSADKLADLNPEAAAPEPVNSLASGQAIPNSVYDCETAATWGQLATLRVSVLLTFVYI
jgi:hypothetical protein